MEYAQLRDLEYHPVDTRVFN